MLQLIQRGSMLLRSGGPLALYRNHLVRGYLDCFVNGSLTATEHERTNEQKEGRERQRTRRKRITMGSMDGYATAAKPWLVYRIFLPISFLRRGAEESAVRSASQLRGIRPLPSGSNRRIVDPRKLLPNRSARSVVPSLKNRMPVRIATWHFTNSPR